MERTIHIQTTLPYPHGVVWQALIDAKILGTWFMENNIIPEKGTEFTFRMAPQKGWDGITHCKIIDVNPFREISYTYCGEATGEKALACAGINSNAADKAGKNIFTKLNTILKFTLTPMQGGTILSLEQSGYKGLMQVIVSLIMQMGWKKQLNKKLPPVLEKLAAEKAAV